MWVEITVGKFLSPARGLIQEPHHVDGSDHLLESGRQAGGSRPARATRKSQFPRPVPAENPSAPFPEFFFPVVSPHVDIEGSTTA